MSPNEAKSNEKGKLIEVYHSYLDQLWLFGIMLNVGEFESALNGSSSAIASANNVSNNDTNNNNNNSNTNTSMENNDETPDDNNNAPGVDVVESEESIAERNAIDAFLRALLATTNDDLPMLM